MAHEAVFTSYSALTLLSDKAQAEALGIALENIQPEPTGIGVFELEDGSALWEVGAYFIDPPDEAALALLAAAYAAKPFVISGIPEADWVAKVKRELHPVEAGRFFLYGSHDADKIPQNPAIEPLLIEASMAFGTGHHGTTAGCLWALDELAVAGLKASRVADIGCGTAVLAMAAARLWPKALVLASDIDPVATDVAIANLAANDMSNSVKTHVAAGFDAPELANNAPYDLIFANILMGPLLDLAKPMADQLRPGGYAILSGLLNEQADRVTDHYRNYGLLLEKSRILGEWTTLTLRKQSEHTA